MVMIYSYMVSLCSAGLDEIKQYDGIYGNDRVEFREKEPVPREVGKSHSNSHVNAGGG